ncbi:MAG: response regulator [Bacteroidales bacterium]|nr:response regulator [Bacteroidales bacterium]
MIINKQKILAVDDHPVNRRLLEGILAKEYDIITAANGADALAICTNESIDLVLLDIMMPEMDGYEVCERIKANLNTKHIPVIFLTAKTETKDIVKGFDVGGVDYVTKPFKKVELLARVKTHIELKTLRGILPYCSICGLIRDDTGVEHGMGKWVKADTFVTQKTDARVSHGYCPNCLENEMDSMRKKSETLPKQIR